MVFIGYFNFDCYQPHIWYIRTVLCGVRYRLLYQTSLATHHCTRSTVFDVVL